MFGIDDLTFYAAVIGGGAVVGNLAPAVITKLRNKNNKIATSEFGKVRNLKGLTGENGLMLSKKVQLDLKSCFEGVCILGPTGSGKTTSFFFPNLLSNDLPKCSLVVADPKGELFRLTAWYQKFVCGREPILFSPLQPQNSFKYNLLENCQDASEVIQLGATLLLNGSLSIEVATGKKGGGIEWIEMATPLFTASLLYCWEHGSPLNTIERAFKLVLEHDEEELDLLFNNASEDVQNQYNIFKAAAGASNTVGGIKITMATNLKLFTDTKLNETLMHSEFKPEDLRKKPTCLYVMYPERKSNYLSPFTASFFSQLIDKTIDSYTDYSLPVIYFWDEFANLGQLSNMSINAATVRSRKIGLVTCLQSLTQLMQVYGRYNALSILNNLKTKVVLPGLSDIETLNYISELSGNTEVNITSKSESKSDKTDSISTSTNYSTTKKRLLDPDEVRRLGNNELLIIMHNRQPVKDIQNVYYKQDMYLRNVKKVDFPVRNKTF